MTWIFKASPDGNGGHVSMHAVDPKTMDDWYKTLASSILGDLSDAYHGNNIPFQMTHAPRHFVTPKRITAFKDLFWVEGKMLIISDQLRVIIQAHDPDVHHIWPIQVMSKKGVTYPDALYGFVPTVHAAAISETEGDVCVEEESTHPPTKLFPMGMWSPRRTGLDVTWSAAVDASKCPPNHIWWDHGLTENHLLLSDPLHEAIVAAGLKVIPMKKTKLAKQPNL